MNCLVLNSEITLEVAIRMLDENGNGFLPVTDSENVLLGVITDGDLRRGILNKQSSVESIMNTHPITMPADTPSSVVRKKLREIHRRQMPLIDKKGKLLDVVVLNDFEVSSKNNWVVIMAGGLGSRLGDLTKDTPKPMLPLAGKPILLHIIESFMEYGFKKFVLCVNYKAHKIEEYFEDGSELGIQIRYTYEEKRMGTAGALSLLESNIEGDFFVVNGDILTTLNFEDFLNFHTQNHSMASMCIKRHSFQVPFACVGYDEGKNLKSISEKPEYNFHINAGLYLLNHSVLKFIPNDSYYDMPELFEKLVSDNEVVKVFSMEDYWLDVGRPDDYKKGNNDFNVSK